MRPPPRKTRAILFNLLWLIAFPGNLAAAALNYVIWSVGIVGEQLYARLIESGWGTYAAAGAALALAVIVVPATYLASLDWRRPARPVLRLYLLWLSVAANGAGYILGTSKVEPSNFPVLVGAALAILLVPLLPIGLERMLGLGKIRAADRMLRSGHPAAALPVVKLGLMFQPGHPVGRRTLGLALARRGRTAAALPFLEEAYESGDRSPDLLITLASAAESEGDLHRAATLVEELHTAQPATERFERLIQLWLANDEQQRVLNALWALSPEERLPWADTLQQLLSDRHDRSGLRKLARELEHEGAPFNRSRRCFERLLDLAPADEEVLEEAADLWDRAGDRAGSLNLLERLESLQKSPRPDLLRRLAASYDGQGRAADALRQRIRLVDAGMAYRDEKLAVMEDAFSRGDYVRTIQIVTSNEELLSDPQAAATLALAWYETNEPDQALEQAARARELNPPASLAGELASLENRIREQKLADELAALAKRVEAAPEDLELRFEYLDRLTASKAADKVVVLLEELLARRPELNARVSDEVTGLLERHGSNARLAGYLADLRLRAGDWDGAFTTAETVARGSLNSLRVLHDWASKILRSNPAHAPSLLAEVRYEAAAGNATAALSRLEQYGQAGGERTAEVVRLEMESSLTAGQLERADAAGMALLALDPGNTDLQMELAEIALRREDYRSALDRMGAVLQVEPQRPRLQLLIRQTEERAKEARITELRSLADQGKGTPETHEEAGDLLHDLGRLNEAIVEYQRSSLSDPARHVARAKLAYVLARKGMHAEAEEELSRSELRPDQDREEQARLKALFFSTAEVMADDSQEARALALLKRIFHVDAGYRDVLPRIEHLQRIVTKKQQQRW